MLPTSRYSSTLSTVPGCTPTAKPRVAAPPGGCWRSVHRRFALDRPRGSEVRGALAHQRAAAALAPLLALDQHALNEARVSRRQRPQKQAAVACTAQQRSRRRRPQKQASLNGRMIPSRVTPRPCRSFQSRPSPPCQNLRYRRCSLPVRTRRGRTRSSTWLTLRWERRRQRCSRSLRWRALGQQTARTWWARLIPMCGENSRGSAR